MRLGGMSLALGDQQKGGSSGPPLAITSLSDDLGDTFGGHPLVITITSGTAFAVEIGGVECTSFSQVGNTITCLSPPLAAGVYGVQVMSTLGDGPVLPNAFEAWTWTVDVPAIRLFQADAGTTSATTTTRLAFAERAKSIRPSFIPRDGAQIFELASGRLIMVGGWSSVVQASWPDALGNPSPITNEILASDEKGREGTWFVLLAHDPNPPTTGPTARFKPGHGMAFCPHVVDGARYAYVIGSDSNAGVDRDGGVWRTQTGATWERIATNAPTIGKSLMMCASYNGRIHMFEELTGELVSAWADRGSGALSLVQATADERPLLVPGAFYGGVPGLAFTGGQALGLAAKDAAIAGGIYECDARVRTEDSTTPAQGDVTIDTPNPVIDVSAGSKFNGSGLDVDSFEYHDGSIAWAGGIANTSGVKMNDGVARSFGARHQTADLRLYINGVQNGPTKTAGIGFSTTHTGWQHIGMGFYPANRGRFVLGYAVAAKQSLSASTRAKGAKWARKFRTEP